MKKRLACPYFSSLGLVTATYDIPFLEKWPPKQQGSQAHGQVWTCHPLQYLEMAAEWDLRSNLKSAITIVLNLSTMGKLVMTGVTYNPPGFLGIKFWTVRLFWSSQPKRTFLGFDNLTSFLPPINNIPVRVPVPLLHSLFTTFRNSNSRMFWPSENRMSGEGGRHEKT